MSHTQNPLNGDTVFVCFEENTDPAAGRQKNRPVWLCAGVLADEADAEGWVDGRDDRMFMERTVGVVESRYPE